MALPQSAEVSPPPIGDLQAAVLIPLRSLDDGKHRLSDTLSQDDRATAIRTMAETVLAAAHELPVLVVHDSPAVAAWARSHNAMAHRPDTPGLNAAVVSGCEVLRQHGFTKVIIAHADLPVAEDLRTVLTSHPVSIVADRHRDGTNVLCIDLNLEFTFAYGPGSFASHCAVSRALEIEPYVIDAPDLAWDVDYPSDLEGLPKGLA